MIRIGSPVRDTSSGTTFRTGDISKFRRIIGQDNFHLATRILCATLVGVSVLETKATAAPIIFVANTHTTFSYQNGGSSKSSLMSNNDDDDQTPHREEATTVPRSGAFYLHDDRYAKKKKKRRKPKQEEVVWKHDKFVEDKFILDPTAPSFVMPTVR